MTSGPREFWARAHFSSGSSGHGRVTRAPNAVSSTRYPGSSSSGCSSTSRSPAGASEIADTVHSRHPGELRPGVRLDVADPEVPARVGRRAEGGLAAADLGRGRGVAAEEPVVDDRARESDLPLRIAPELRVREALDRIPPALRERGPPLVLLRLADGVRVGRREVRPRPLEGHVLYLGPLQRRVGVELRLPLRGWLATCDCHLVLLRPRSGHR